MSTSTNRKTHVVRGVFPRTLYSVWVRLDRGATWANVALDCSRSEAEKIKDGYDPDYQVKITSNNTPPSI